MRVWRYGTGAALLSRPLGFLCHLYRRCVKSHLRFGRAGRSYCPRLHGRCGHRCTQGGLGGGRGTTPANIFHASPSVSVNFARLRHGNSARARFNELFLMTGWACFIARNWRCRCQPACDADIARNRRGSSPSPYHSVLHGRDGRSEGALAGCYAVVSCGCEGHIINPPFRFRPWCLRGRVRPRCAHQQRERAI